MQCDTGILEGNEREGERMIKRKGHNKELGENNESAEEAI